MWVDTKTDIHKQKEQEEILEQAIEERTEELRQANQQLLRQNQEIEKQKTEMEAFMETGKVQEGHTAISFLGRPAPGALSNF